MGAGGENVYIPAYSGSYLLVTILSYLSFAAQLLSISKLMLKCQPGSFDDESE